MKKHIRRGAAVLVCLLLLASSALAAEAQTLVPVGQTVGLELYTDGVYVVKFDETEGCSPAKDAGLAPGDRITEADGKRLESAEDLRRRIAEAGDRRLTLAVDRGGRPMSFSVRPIRREGGWRIGIFVQDRITGLGTVTFYDPETGLFGALGHGVGKSGTAGSAALRGGLALRAEITGVRRGEAGNPGQLLGRFADREALGQVELNASQGIFGRCGTEAFAGEALPTARREEISTGPAEIWCSVCGGEPVHYSARIEAIRFGTESGRNLRLQITDERLLAGTGGIVQGMSGSPIIQNGKLVGAVTHVLIQDPARGYGIWIGDMLRAAEEQAADGQPADGQAAEWQDPAA